MTLDELKAKRKRIVADMRRCMDTNPDKFWRLDAQVDKIDAEITALQDEPGALAQKQREARVRLLSAT